MSRRHARLNWTYDDDRQELTAPSGVVVTVQEIAQRLQDDAACRYDFGGLWLGWKMRGPRLIPPHCGQAAAAITPRSGPLLLRWIEAAKSEWSGRRVVLPFNARVRPDEVPGTTRRRGPA